MAKSERLGVVTFMDAWSEMYPELPDWVAARRAEGVGPVVLCRRLVADFDIRIDRSTAERWLAESGPAKTTREYRRGPLTTDDPRHGTLTGYTNHGCDCELTADGRPGCKVVWREYHSDYRKRHRRNYRVEAAEAQQLADLLAAKVRLFSPTSQAYKAWRNRSWRPEL